MAQLERLGELKPYAEDAAFRARWHEVKQQNKERLAQMVAEECGVDFDPDALFVV